MPEDARIVNVGHDSVGHLSIWALVEHDAQAVVRRFFKAFKNDEHIPDEIEDYVTTSIAGGQEAHLFAVDAPKPAAPPEQEATPLEAGPTSGDGTGSGQPSPSPQTEDPAEMQGS